MTAEELRRAYAIREILLDETTTPAQLGDVLANNSLLLARIIEYYGAAWEEVESFTQALRVVTGSAP